MPNGRVVMHDIDAQVHDRSPDLAIAALAVRQHGVVGRAQLTGIGIGRGAIGLRLRHGRLHQLHRGVYAVGHRLLTPRGRRMAAVLAAGPGAVLSHEAAAAHWGIRPSHRRTVDVTVGRALRQRRGLRLHRSSLPADEVTVHAGIPVTGVTRTVFDLAAVVSLGPLGRAVREVDARRLWDRLSLPDMIARHPRRPGAGAVKALIEGEAYVTRSELEERVVAMLDAAGLERPLANVTIHLGDRFIEVDLAWPRHGVVVELDGHATHGTRASFEDDRARDRALVAAGWRVIRITWRQLRDEPEAVTRDVRAALAHRMSPSR